jgi:hypothetical protein
VQQPFAPALYRIHRQLFTSHRWGEVRRLPPCEDLVAQQFEKQKRRSNGNSGNQWLDGRSCRFAAVMMMLMGTFHALTGLSAILENEFFVVTSEIRL